MPVPDTHIQERLSVAYVSAVVSRAGYLFWLPPGIEYGTDGMIQKVYYIWYITPMFEQFLPESSNVSFNLRTKGFQRGY